VTSMDINGTDIVYSSRDSNGYVHDLSDGSYQYSISQSNTVSGAGISDNYVGICGQNSRASVFNVSDGSGIGSFSGVGGYYVNDIDFFNDYVMYSRSDYLYCYDIGNSNRQFRVSVDGSNNCQTCDVKDGLAIYSNSNDPHVVSVPDGNQKKVLKESNSRTSEVAISSDFTAYTAGNKVYINKISDWSSHTVISESGNELNEVSLKQS
jgi:hypothetical protein